MNSCSGSSVLRGCFTYLMPVKNCFDGFSAYSREAREVWAKNIGDLNKIAQTVYRQYEDFANDETKEGFLRNRLGWTALHIAADQNNAHAAQSLIKKGLVQINEKDRSCYPGRTPIQIAAEKGNIKVTKVLIENTANIEGVVQSATLSGKVEFLEYLLFGENVYINQKEISDSFYLAIKKGDIDVIKLYLNRYPDLVNSSLRDGNSTALHVAAQENDLGVVRLLVESGADVNVQNATASGTTPLSDAAQLGNCSIVDYLIKKGANVNLKNKNGETPLIATTMCSNDKPTMQLLINAGADINAEILINTGADINAKNNSPETALSRSLRHPNFDAANFLFLNGAIFDINNYASKVSLSVGFQPHQQESRATFLLNVIKQNFNKSPDKIFKEIIYKYFGKDEIEILTVHLKKILSENYPPLQAGALRVISQQNTNNPEQIKELTVANEYKEPIKSGAAVSTKELLIFLSLYEKLCAYLFE